MNFKVGDYITALPRDLCHHPYSVTTEYSVCQVSDIGPVKILVTVIEDNNPGDDDYIGHEFWVLPEYFVRHNMLTKRGNKLNVTI